MKQLLGVSSIIFLISLFATETTVTSCTKQTTIWDTVKITKHDTTIIIHKDTTNVPAKDTVFAMDVNSWNLFTTTTNSFLSPGPTTYLNTSEGIKFFPQAARTGVRLGTKTEVGFKDKVIYYKWKVYGAGQFADYVPQVKYEPNTLDGVPFIQGADFSEFTLVNSVNNSTVIQENVWYYTRVIALKGTDNYQVTTSTGNYDNNGGAIVVSNIVPVYTKNGYISIRIGDCYNTSTYCILGECKIASN